VRLLYDLAEKIEDRANPAYAINTPQLRIPWFTR